MGGEDGRVSEAQLVEWVEEGQDKLNKHDLKGAEIVFWKVLSNTPSSRPAPPASDSVPPHQRLPRILQNEDELALNRPAVTALLGLAEVFTKKGRGARHNELEWHRMYIQAISSGQQAMNCCDYVIGLSPQHKLSTWFSEQKQKSRKDLKLLEDVVVRSVEDRLIKKPSYLAGKMMPKTEEQLANPCNIDWLSGFRGYCKEKQQTETDWSKYDFSEEETKKEEIKPQPVVKEEPKKKKLDYKKVQAVIQKLVQDIASEMKTLKIHPGLTPEEKLNLVSPMGENYDIVRAFHKMMTIEERSDEKSEDENGNSEEGGAKVNGHGGGFVEDSQSEDGINLGESASEKGVSASRTLKHTLRGRENLKLPLSQVSATKQESLSESKKTRHTPTQRDFDRERPAGSFGFTTLKHGVLTIWRSYDNADQVETNNNPRLPVYFMESFEELSPLTEFGRNGETLTEDPMDYRRPNSEGNMSVALGHIVARLADRMRNMDKMKEATDLYKFSLGIFQEYCSCAAAVKDQMAQIMRNLGIIKCSRGDFMSGSQLLENCIRMYESNHSEGANLWVARTWYDLGNAFLSQQWDDHVMRSVKVALETEVKRELSNPEDLAEDSDDDDSSAGESYWVSNQEAIECYKNALAIVQRGRLESTQKVVLYVELLNRIGDCSIASGNYEHAILCYEEAIYMFKTVVGSAMIELNAHALTMLGTANYLLSNFSKAVSMYECAQLLHQHIYGSLEDGTFEVAFTLTMLAISLHSLKHFHKSISWCLKAFELYTTIYKDNFHDAHALHKWFVIETLYLLGFSYSTLSFFEKSLHYLGISRDILTASKDGDTKQCVKILKCMADVYQSMGDEENALRLYDEALEWSGSLGYEKSATALQNQLLNRMAGVHVNSKDYGAAAKYLEQALDCQRNVENTIKDDLIGIQKQLAVTYTLAGDLDKAIECYTEVSEAYEDIPNANPSDVANNLGTLATLHYVKSCLQEDNEEMLELLTTSEAYYQEAVELDPKSTIAVEYANFLYHQDHFSEALLTLLPVIHFSDAKAHKTVIEYNGVEQAILPDQIQPDVDEMEQVVFRTDILAHFLAVLCYRNIGLLADAEENLIALIRLVLQTGGSLNHSLLGHAMMEMGLYEEAALSFSDSANLQHDKDLTLTNHWLALCTWAYTTLEKAVYNAFVAQAEEAVRKEDEAEWAKRNLRSSGIRDSGYYDHGTDDKEEEVWTRKLSKSEPIVEEEVWRTSENTVETPPHILELLKRQREGDGGTTVRSASDVGYNSTEHIHDKEDVAEDVRDKTWNDEETVETPAALLELLRKQQEETDKVLERLSLSHQNLAMIGQDDNVDNMEEGLGKKWDKHQEDMEDKSEQILQAITQRQSQLEGMLSTIKRSMENVGDSDSSLNEYEPRGRYAATSSTEDMRKGRLGGGLGFSKYSEHVVSNEDLRHRGLSEFRMTKSSEDLTRPLSITQSSENILTNALNSYSPSRKRSTESEDRRGSGYTPATRSPHYTRSVSYSHDAPMDLSPDEDDTASRLQRYKKWAVRRNIPVSSSFDKTAKSWTYREHENTNASNNNIDNLDTSENSNITTYTSFRSTRLASDNNNGDDDADNSRSSTRWGSVQNRDAASRRTEPREPVVEERIVPVPRESLHQTSQRQPVVEEPVVPVIEDRASRMKRYAATSSSTSRPRNPYQGFSGSLSSTEQGVASENSNNTFSSRFDSNPNSRSSSSSGSQRAADSRKQDTFEVWESEEVVETPPELLKVLMAKQQLH